VLVAFGGDHSAAGDSGRPALLETSLNVQWMTNHDPGAPSCGRGSAIGLSVADAAFSSTAISCIWWLEPE
jgi:hypothetical protein